MQQLEHAARALGWHGPVIPDVDVLGTRFSAMTRFRCDVHEWRLETGWPPVLDPTGFRSWSEPSVHDHLPMPAVELVGILAPVAKARYALRACGTMLTLTPCTAVLPADHPYKPLRMMELNYYGVGVVRAGSDGAELVLRPEDRSAEFGSSLFGRWLLEVLYSRMLDCETTAPERTTGS